MDAKKGLQIAIDELEAGGYCHNHPQIIELRKYLVCDGTECLCPMLEDGLCHKEKAGCYMVKKEKCTNERMCNNCYSGQGKCLNQ